MSSPIEVEFKFPVDNLVELRESLLALGAQPVKVSEQVDEYFNDPLRDFAKMDICLLYTSPSPRDRQKSRMPSSA